MAKIDKSAILLGRANIYVAPSDDFISQTNPALDSNKYLGITQDCKLKNTRKFQDVHKVGSAMPIDRYLDDYAISLAANILNIEWKTLAFLYGEDPYTEANELSLSPYKFTGDVNEWRVEAEFIYPNKTDRLVVILPRTTLKNPSDLSLVNLNSPDNAGFEFSGVEERTSYWVGFEAGKIVLDTV